MTKWHRMLGAAVASAGAFCVRPAQGDADPVAQCIAASDSGLELRKSGKLLEARKVLASCASPACGAEISETCQKRIQDINDSLPTIVFAPKDGAGNDLEGVALSIDGTPYGEGLKGNPIVVDPGEHEFRFVVGGQAPVVKRLVLLQGEHNRRQEVVIGSPPAPAPPPPASAQPETKTPASPPSPEAAKPQARGSDEAPASEPWNGQKTEAVLWGGAGIASAVAGSLFGLIAIGQWGAATTECHQTYLTCGPNSTAQHDKDAASQSATLSDVFFVAGGLLAGLAAVRWFTAPTGAKAQLAPALSPQGAGFTFRETF